MEILNKEREVAGIYISGHPLEDYKIEIDNFCNSKVNDLEDLKKLRNKDLSFAGIVTSVAHKTTKTGKPFGTMIIEDYEGSTQLSLFSEDYLKYKHFFNNDSLLLIKARVQPRYYQSDQFELKIHSISLLSEVLAKCVSGITVQMSLIDISEDLIDKISKSLKKKTGQCKIKFAVYDTFEKTSIELPARKIRVDSADFLKIISLIPELKFKLS